MSYAEAIEATITRQQAIRELKLHSITEEGLAEFFAELGDKAEYSGAEVLAWLGY
jgi:hypothetical protein